MIGRLTSLLPLFALAAGCRSATEIVIALETVGAPPSSIRVNIHRSTPFADNPKATPPFVQSAINDRGELDLDVAPQGTETRFALLPPSSGSLDLEVLVSATGFTVSPAEAQAVQFHDHSSQDLHFTIAAPPPDGGRMDGPRDGGRTDGGGDGGPKDGGSKG